MAKEILVIDQHQVIFFLLFEEPPIIIAGEPQALTQPSSALPTIAADFMGPALMQIIDDGRVAWRVFPVTQGATETDAHLLARAKYKWTFWAAQESARIVEWAAQIAEVRWINI
jgi:hypothetical protein